MLAALVASAAPVAAKLTKSQLIDQWALGLEACHASDWENPNVLAICDAGNKAVLELNKRGWCFGRKSDKGRYLYRWHRCVADSWRG